MHSDRSGDPLLKEHRSRNLRRGSNVARKVVDFLSPSTPSSSRKTSSFRSSASRSSFSLKRSSSELAFEPSWRDKVRRADSAAAIEAVITKPEDISAAIEERYILITHEMGFATHGLRHFACIGGAAMSVIGLTLTLAGIHVGVPAFAIGAAVLTFFLVAGLLHYTWCSIHFRTTKKGQAALASHLEVLRKLRDMAAQHPHENARAKKTLERSFDVIHGNISFVALELLRGTIIGPIVDFIAGIQDAWDSSETVQNAKKKAATWCQQAWRSRWVQAPLQHVAGWVKA